VWGKVIHVIWAIKKNSLFDQTLGRLRLTELVGGGSYEENGSHFYPPNLEEQAERSV